MGPWDDDVAELMKKISFKEEPIVAPKELPSTSNNNEEQQPVENSDDYYENRLLKPLPETLFFGELRELADVIQR